METLSIFFLTLIVLIKTYSKSFLETNPQQTVPAKCPEWKVLYSSEYIESKLDDKQLKEYKRNLKVFPRCNNT